MLLPKELNQLILKFVESPRIPDLLYQLWVDQLEYGNATIGRAGYSFWTITTYQIQPSDPLGRQTFAGGWTSHVEFKIIRRTFHNLDVDYKFEIEVVWRGGHGGDALSVYNDEWDDDTSSTSFPLAFSVLGTMPRICTDAPEYFVGHVYDIEVDTSLHRGQTKVDREHLYSGGFSFEANSMLELVESLPLRFVSLSSASNSH